MNPNDKISKEGEMKRESLEVATEGNKPRTQIFRQLVMTVMIFTVIFRKYIFSRRAGLLTE